LNLIFKLKSLNFFEEESYQKTLLGSELFCTFAIEMGKKGLIPGKEFK